MSVEGGSDAYGSGRGDDAQSTVSGFGYYRYGEIYQRRNRRIDIQSENTGQLKEILERCIQGEFDLVQMGRNARNVYEEYFSMEAFENRLMELIANQI